MCLLGECFLCHAEGVLFHNLRHRVETPPTVGAHGVRPVAHLLSHSSPRDGLIYEQWVMVERVIETEYCHVNVLLVLYSRKIGKIFNLETLRKITKYCNIVLYVCDWYWLLPIFITNTPTCSVGGFTKFSRYTVYTFCPFSRSDNVMLHIHV